MSFCKDCDCWHNPFPSGDGETFGQCDNVLVEGMVVVEKRPDIMDEIYEAEKGLFTDQYFGCIHFEKMGGNIVSEIKPFN